MQARQIIFPEKNRAALEQVEVPEAGPHGVLVRTEVSLISAGTELTGLLGVREESRFPMRPGYSNVGVVEAVGSEVTGFSPGDRVLSNGRHVSHHVVNRDPDDRNGPQLLLKVPADVSAEAATFTTLGAVAMHGVRKAAPQLGESAVVIGQGVVGQLIAQLLRASGAWPVIGVDMFPLRLEMSLRGGTTVTVNSAEEDTAAAVERATGGRGADLGLDATRNPQTLPLLMQLAAQSGRIVIVGSIMGSVEIPLYDPLQTKELTIMGAHQPRSPVSFHPYNPWTQERNWQTFLNLLANGVVRVEHMITHREQPESAPAVYEMIRAGGSGWLGVTFVW